MSAAGLQAACRGPRAMAGRGGRRIMGRMPASVALCRDDGRGDLGQGRIAFRARRRAAGGTGGHQDRRASPWRPEQAGIVVDAPLARLPAGPAGSPARRRLSPVLLARSQPLRCACALSDSASPGVTLCGLASIAAGLVVSRGSPRLRLVQRSLPAVSRVTPSPMERSQTVRPARPPSAPAGPTMRNGARHRSASLPCFQAHRGI